MVDRFLAGDAFPDLEMVVVRKLVPYCLDDEVEVGGIQLCVQDVEAWQTHFDSVVLAEHCLVGVLVLRARIELFHLETQVTVIKLLGVRVFLLVLDVLVQLLQAVHHH